MGKEASIESLKETQEAEEEDLEKEEIEDRFEDVPPDAFVDGESKSNSDEESKFPFRFSSEGISSEGNGDVTNYAVWLALPLVLLLFVAAYRCKSRRGGSPMRSPGNGNDGYDDVQVDDDFTIT